MASADAETKPPMILNREGRYIEGPPFGKVPILLDHGALIIPPFVARSFRRHFEEGGPQHIPFSGGARLALVAVIDNLAFQAALWVKDALDFDRVLTSHEAVGSVRFFLIDVEKLEGAKRELQLHQ